MENYKIKIQLNQRPSSTEAPASRSEPSRVEKEPDFSESVQTEMQRPASERSASHRTRRGRAANASPVPVGTATVKDPYPILRGDALGLLEAARVRADALATVITKDEASTDSVHTRSSVRYSSRGSQTPRVPDARWNLPQSHHEEREASPPRMDKRAWKKVAATAGGAVVLGVVMGAALLRYFTLPWVVPAAAPTSAQSPIPSASLNLSGQTITVYQAGVFNDLSAAKTLQSQLQVKNIPAIVTTAKPYAVFVGVASDGKRLSQLESFLNGDHVDFYRKQISMPDVSLKVPGASVAIAGNCAGVINGATTDVLLACSATDPQTVLRKSAALKEMASTVGKLLESIPTGSNVTWETSLKNLASDAAGLENQVAGSGTSDGVLLSSILSFMGDRMAMASSASSK